MAARRISAIAALLASTAGPGLARAAAPVEGKDAVSAEQVVAPASGSAVATEQVNRQPQAPLGVTQLPEGLQPLAPGGEEQLEGPTGPPRTLTAEVIAAWTAIRTRGQVPTPDLIAREIGPGKLAEFLASSPGAASVLATGQDPDPRSADPGGEPERGPAVKILVPPGHS